MGTWGRGAFDNDVVLDWLDDLEHADVEYVRDALSGVAETDDEDLDADECRAAVAAAEIVAAARGRAIAAVPPEVSSWLTAHAPSVNAADAVAARDVVARIARRAEGRGDAWRFDLGDLVQRLRPAA